MYNAAVIGLGKIGLLYDYEEQRPHPSTHVFSYEMSPEYQVVCCIDGDSSKEKLLNQVSNTKYYSSLEDAVKSGSLDNIDVISICTPPATHLIIIKELLKTGVGKVLFCEKPIVDDLKEAKELIELVHQTGVTLIPNISRRWNTGLREVSTLLGSGKYGKVEKINIRYTRGVYNTGSHLFDLLKMWTGSPIRRVFALNTTPTSALPENSYSFYFEQQDGVTGYAEAIDDRQYYLFDIDVFCTDGKIEMRNSGDDVNIYVLSKHHLFQGFNELRLESNRSGLLNDACIRNAVNNISNVLKETEKPFCTLIDAVYPLYVAQALDESFSKKEIVEVKYE